MNYDKDKYELHLAAERQKRGLNLSFRNIVFDPNLHHRDLTGKFKKMLDRLEVGQSVSMPDGHKVTALDGDRFKVKKPTKKDSKHASLTRSSKGTHTYSAGMEGMDSRPLTRQIAEDVLSSSAQQTHPDSVGGSTSYSAGDLADKREMANWAGGTGNKYGPSKRRSELAKARRETIDTAYDPNTRQQIWDLSKSGPSPTKDLTDALKKMKPGQVLTPSDSTVYDKKYTAWDYPGPHDTISKTPEGFVVDLARGNGVTTHRSAAQAALVLLRHQAEYSDSKGSIGGKYRGRAKEQKWPASKVDSFHQKYGMKKGK